MSKTLSLFNVLLLLMLSVTAHAGDTPGTYTNYQFDPAVTALNSVDFGITVKADPGYRANVYWSNQFSPVVIPACRATAAAIACFCFRSGTRQKPGPEAREVLA